VGLEVLASPLPPEILLTLSLVLVLFMMQVCLVAFHFFSDFELKLLILGVYQSVPCLFSNGLLCFDSIMLIYIAI